MGRGGRGGGSRGGSRGSRGGSRRSSGGSSFRSSGSSSFGGSSFRGGGNPPPPSRGYSSFRTTHHHHHYGGPTPPPPPHGGYRRTYNTGYRRSSGCASGCGSLMFIILFIVILFMTVGVRSCGGMFGLDTQINEDVVADNAEAYYDKNFDDRGDVFLVYVTYSDKLDEEYVYYVWGASATRYVDSTLDAFDEMYWNYMHDDMAVQLADVLEEYTVVLENLGLDKLEGERFDSKCYDDNLGYIDNGSILKDAAEDMFDRTGVQFFVVTDQYDDMEGAKTDNSKVWITLIIVIAVIIIIYMLIQFWKKKKEQKNKEMEQQIKILNTPLEEFGSNPNDIDNLAKKYDDAEKSSDSDNQ